MANGVFFNWRNFISRRRVMAQRKWIEVIDGIALICELWSGGMVQIYLPPTGQWYNDNTIVWKDEIEK